jgi:hypothetical protein
MLTQVKAEIEINGTVRLLEPLKLKRKSRAIVTLLDDDAAEDPVSAEETMLAEERFARHIGSVTSGNPTSADNEQIDVDLATEYLNPHDDKQ